MSIASTNKKKSANINQLPQANLHVKILDLVTNRINPYKKGVVLQNGDCQTCITVGDKSPERLSKNKLKNQKKSISKNVRLKTEFPTRSGTNTTTHNNSFYDHSRPSLPYIRSPHLVKEAKPPLGLHSKVISLSIDSTKMADLTIDLRGEIQPEFISSKFLCKLKLELIQKQERIRQLQKELQLKVYHIQQLNKDIQSLIEIERKKSHSDNHLTHFAANDHPFTSLQEMLLIQRKSQKGGRSFSIIQPDNASQEGQIVTKEYQYLLRIIKAQANELENVKFLDPFANKYGKSLSRHG